MKFFTAVTLVIAICVIGCNRKDTTPTSTTEITDSGDTVTMDPNKILFSTPTLNDAIPATLQGSTVPPDCIQLHEDDWRQFEFVPRNRKSDVDAELADISAIWNNHSVPLGDSGKAFHELHIRKRIPIALDIPMSLSEFEAFLGQSTKPMTFFDYGEVLRDVRAVAIDKLVVYAQVQDDTITAIGFDAVDKFTLPPEFAKRLSEFVRTHDLMLVHWRSRTLFESHREVMDYFGIQD